MSRRRVLREFPIRIRYGIVDDVKSIAVIARQYPSELGFLSNVKIKSCIEKKECFVAAIDNQVVGFILFHKRKDGWTTIYDLAVDKNHTTQGIGRFLLYSVPTPNRLKCTSDNQIARDFYLKSGMVVSHVEMGRKRDLYVYERCVLSIFCMGDNRRFPDCAYQSGMAWGSRHDAGVYQQPFMLDINWEKYDWSDYLSKIERFKPVMASAPDFESLDQLPILLQQIQDLRDRGVLRIIVCAKFEGCVQYIPEDCIIGVSVPTKEKSKYKGYLTENLKKELIGKTVHLLGGSPNKQAELIKEFNWYGIWILSIDGNSYQKKAKFGGWFDGTKWVNKADPSLSHYDLIVISGNNVRKTLHKAMQTKSCPCCHSESDL